MPLDPLTNRLARFHMQVLLPATHVTALSLFCFPLLFPSLVAFFYSTHLNVVIKRNIIFAVLGTLGPGMCAVPLSSSLSHLRTVFLFLPHLLFFSLSSWLSILSVCADQGWQLVVFVGRACVWVGFSERLGGGAPGTLECSLLLSYSLGT